MPTKPKVKYRYRYRDHPHQAAQVEITGGPVNVGGKVTNIANRVRDFQQIIIVLGFIGSATWLFLGPFVDAKAEELLKNKLIQIGMDPANIQALNKNLEELQKSSEERAKTVEDLKTDLDKVLYLLEQQNLQRSMVYPPIAQAAPIPLQIQPIPMQTVK